MSRADDSHLNDTQSHFLVIVGDLCKSARLAGLPVEIRTESGLRVTGVPHPRDAADQPHEVDDTGWARPLVVGGQTLDLAAVSEIRIRRPAGP
jgi:hypothetical protein